MARYGALTALQAALLGISGGAQGLVQAREREQREKERKDAQQAQEFARRISMVQNRVRPMQPSAPGAPAPEGFTPVGSLGGVQYEAMTPEAIAGEASAAELRRIRAVAGEQSKIAQENWTARLPEVEAALSQFNERELPKNVRGLIRAGAFGLDPAAAIKTAFDIAESNRRLNIEASRTSQAGSQRGTYTTAEIRKVIADRVSDFQKSIATATKEVPETRTIEGREVPIPGKSKRVPYSATERRALVDEFRTSIEAEYAPLLGAPTPAAAATGGTAGGTMRTPAPTAAPAASPVLDLDTLGRGGRAAPAAAPIAPPAMAPRMPGSPMSVGAPQQRPRFDNISRIMENTAYGMQGEPATLPYTIAGRTYNLPR